MGARDEGPRPARRPGRGQGHPGARPGPPPRPARIATGDLFRAAVRDGTPLGLEARGTWTRRAGPGRDHGPDAPGAAGRPGRGARARSSTASPAPAPRPRRSTRARRARRPRSTPPSSSTSPRRTCSGASPGAGSARRPAMPTTRPHTRRAWRASATWTARRCPARRRQAGDRPGPAGEQLGALDDVVDHYRSAGVLRTVDGRRPIAEVTADLARGDRAGPVAGARSP